MSTFAAEGLLLNAIRYDSRLRYESGYDLYDSLSRETDLVWATTTLKMLAISAPYFTASANAICIAYGTALTALSVFVVPSDDPIGGITTPGSLLWTGATAYANALTRLNTEAVAVSGVAPYGVALASALRGAFRSYPNVSLAEYVDQILRPALLEFGAAVSGNSVVDQPLEGSLELREIIADLPRATYGNAPLYTIREGDTVESIATTIYGDSERWADVVAAYKLYPPYLSDTSTPQTLSPGDRIVLPNNAVTFGAEEAYGIGWALDVQRGTGGDEWDIDWDDGSGIAEVSGVNAVTTDLILRASQPLEDLTDEYMIGYGVPNLLGQNASTVENFVLAQAMLQDNRVADAYISDGGGTTRKGLFVNDVTVILRDPAATI